MRGPPLKKGLSGKDFGKCCRASEKPWPWAVSVNGFCGSFYLAPCGEREHCPALSRLFSLLGPLHFSSATGNAFCQWLLNESGKTLKPKSCQFLANLFFFSVCLLDTVWCSFCQWLVKFSNEASEKTKQENLRIYVVDRETKLESLTVE